MSPYSPACDGRHPSVVPPRYGAGAGERVADPVSATGSIAQAPAKPATGSRGRAAAIASRGNAIAAPDEALHAVALALHTLDEVLTLAVEQQARVLGPASLLDPWRGMHLDKADVQRLLARVPHAPLQATSVAEPLAAAARAVPRWAGAASKYGFTDVDLAILLIALAPDLDLRYERIVGYLQDDITRKRPSADLLANLLAVDPAQRLAVCARLDAESPLLAAGVLVLQDFVNSPWLARPVLVDDLWRDWLLGRSTSGGALGACARLLVPRPDDLSALPLQPAVRAALEQARVLARRRGDRLLVWLHGSNGTGKFALAQALAHQDGARLLVVDARDWSSPAEVRAQVARAACAAALHGAILYLHGWSRLAQREAQLERALVESLANLPCACVLVSAEPSASLRAGTLNALRVPVGFPEAPERAQLWQQALATRGASAEPNAVDRIAARFALNAAQIEQAATEASIAAVLRADVDLQYDALAEAARAQCGAELAQLAQRIAPEADFAALVAPPEVRAQLSEICARVATRETVRREWACGSVHARVVGIAALFVGPSGTGKTLAAEAVARELRLDMYRIDLAGVVSKYIGETEKNLDRVFAAAAHANAVLFFVEADALFGKRSEVKDAHDRYANIEVAYLLQKMEQFDGLAILATNFKQNLDGAFARRLSFCVNFPFPEEAERRRLWDLLWLPGAARADDIDLGWFAHEFRLSGGNIRNTVLAAAHMAAADGQVVTRAHLMQATRREYQKLGKTLVDPRLGAQGQRQ